MDHSSAQTTDGLDPAGQGGGLRLVFASLRGPAASGGRRDRRFRGLGWAGLALMVIAALIAISYLAFYLTLTGAEAKASRHIILVLILVNFALGLGLLAMMAWGLVRFVLRRRGHEPGKRLHVQLVAAFLVIALIPTITVAAFSAVTLNLGLESWFSERTQGVLDNATVVAQQYLNEHGGRLEKDALSLADTLSNAKRARDAGEITRDQFGQIFLGQVQVRLIPAALIFTDDGEVVDRVVAETVAEITPPSPELFAEVRRAPDNVLVRTAAGGAQADQVIALAQLPGYENQFLFVSRPVSAKALALLAAAEESFEAFNLAESTRDSTQLLFALSYVVVALLMLAGALWMGLLAASRIVAPIGQLADAAERVRLGDLKARVRELPSDDEVASLGRAFNRMTAQLDAQRTELMEAQVNADRRRRFTEAVLSGVSAGVIGLDQLGYVTLLNRSAAAFLDADPNDLIGESLVDFMPEIAPLLRRSASGSAVAANGQVEVMRGETLCHLMVRVTREPGDDDTERYVVTFDDITELVSAQRMSVWADVARRVAHEIKNPLTPIQLSAERLRRKYAGEISSNPEIFQQCTDTIVRQVDDLRRMVDEFSSFARMPSAVLKEENIPSVIRDVVFLESAAFADVKISMRLGEGPVQLDCDARLVSQALINIVKNAAESVAARLAKGHDDTPGAVRITLVDRGCDIAVIVEDNGIGLPKEERHRLTEPYRTTRAKGTGLGLAIVAKIMEEHGGSLTLGDIDPEADDALGATGARITLTFIRHLAEENGGQTAGDTLRLPKPAAE